MTIFSSNHHHRQSVSRSSAQNQKIYSRFEYPFRQIHQTHFHFWTRKCQNGLVGSWPPRSWESLAPPAESWPGPSGEARPVPCQSSHRRSWWPVLCFPPGQSGRFCVRTRRYSWEGHSWQHAELPWEENKMTLRRSILQLTLYPDPGLLPLLPRRHYIRWRQKYKRISNLTKCYY